MKKLIYLAIGVVAMLMATSCEKDSFNSTSGEGGFSLALSVNNNETLSSRAALTQNEIVDNAKVDIYMPNFSGKIRSYKYSEIVDEIIYLPTGNGYRVDVIAGEAAQANPDKANFENKSYAGSADFDIVANQITNDVKVTAKINNAITKVTFDQTIAENFNEGYTLTFALAENESNADNTLAYSATQTGEGYFIIDNPITENKLYWSFVGTKKSDGTEFKAKGAIEAPESTGGSLVGTRHTMNFKYVVKDGTLTFTLVVDKDTNTTADKIVWTPTSTGLSTIKNKDIWAKFVTIGGDVDTKEYDGDVYVQYRKSSTDEWATPDVNSDNMVKATVDDKGVLSAVIKDLEPATDYQCRLVVYDSVTAEDGTTSQQWVESVVSEKEFTTAVDQQVPNRSFEDYHMVNATSDYPRFYRTDSDIESHRTEWWDSGNEASAGYGYTICAVETSSVKDGSYAAKLQSRYAIAKFAAGNLFSGNFAGLDGLNGMVDFGRPFTARPTGVSFYIRYKGGTVNRNGSDGPLVTNKDTDKGQIKVALGTWSNRTYGGATAECPVRVNTADKNTFWDIQNLPETIAYAEHICTNVEDSGWYKVTLKLNYNKLNVFPTHIIISAAASMYGDYFNGCDSSDMYLDDIELLYDYETSQLTGPKIE
ncbi:MAG: PCMD domain-containing protein [Alistipes sp.]|nr:PCMD domain-containing protein [Alistipes sp.]